MKKERNARRRSLAEKVSQKINSHTKTGSPYLSLPEGVGMFKVKKAGNVRFNIIPYVAGEKNRETEKGDLDYEFTFYIHRVGEGENQRTVVCPKKTFGHKCPVCEHIEKLKKNYSDNEDEIKQLQAKQRELFNVMDIRDEENSIQVYETAYYKGFGEMLEKRIHSCDEDDEDEDYRNFADIEDGLTLKVNYSEETFAGNKYYAPASIDFLKRKEPVEDEMVDKAVCLDEALKELSYDQILKMMVGDTEDEEAVETKHEKIKPTRKKAQVEEAEEDEAEEVKPSRKPAKQSKKSELEEPEEADDYDDEDEEEEEVQPKKSVKHSKNSEPVEEEEEEEEDEDDEDDEEEEEEDVKPSKKSARKVSKKSEPEPEDEDEDSEDDDEDEDEEETKPSNKKSSKKSKVSDDEEDDEDDSEDYENEDDEDDEDDDDMPVKKAKKSAKGKCPYGYRWGTDAYCKKECDKCELIDECDAADDF